ncbi:hypothetical protein [Agromyces bracchium]|uniref:Uncharacterized protein n=1 Tax=Agromyces bracchium TaxID=88376 RepID=A0A6I3M5A7_9MICO|nr:hypothetical protein [Agromyces bracchium]MTH69800.1 hypothetical protein [Agromyces bracchium]
MSGLRADGSVVGDEHLVDASSTTPPDTETPPASAGATWACTAAATIGSPSSTTVAALGPDLGCSVTGRPAVAGGEPGARWETGTTKGADAVASAPFGRVERWSYSWPSVPR